MSDITNHERFTRIHENDLRTGSTIGEYTIVKDNETGVLYFMTMTQGVNGRGGGVGLTPLLDREGKPILEPVEN